MKTRHPDTESYRGVCAKCNWAVFDTDDYAVDRQNDIYVHMSCLKHMHKFYDVVINSKGNGRGKGCGCSSQEPAWASSSGSCS